MLKLVLTAREAERLIGAAAEGELARADLCTAATRDTTELLVRAALPATAGIQPDGDLFVWRQSDLDDAPPEPAASALDRAPRLAAGLAIGLGSLAGSVRASARIDGALRPIDAIQIVGPTMPRDDLSGRDDRYARAEWLEAGGLYSRAVGNIGLRTLTHLQKIRIAVVGAGSNGSHTTLALARLMGPDASLLLIDHDVLEPFNLPAWGAQLSPPDVLRRGTPKVEVLAENVSRLPEPPRVETCAESIDSWDGRSLARTADILVSCVDSPAARLAVTLLGSALLRPVLDVASGGFVGPNAAAHRHVMEEAARLEANKSSGFGHRLPQPLTTTGPRMRIGDARLIVPGSHEGSGDCLLCAGGVGDLRADAGTEGEARPFWMGRSGSHLPANAAVTAAGADLLLAFLAGLVPGTEHWQLDWSFGHPPAWRQVPARPLERCPVCALRGSGDAGIGRMGPVLDELSRS